MATGSKSPREINFYHVMHGGADQVAVRLCEKVVGANRRGVLLAETQEEVAHLDALLWTFRQQSFIPHGTKKDGFVDDQPIFLTTDYENPNNSDVLVNLQSETRDDFGAFTKVLDVFYGPDQDALARARSRWKAYKEQGHELCYWKQDADTGRFEKMNLS